MTPANAYHRRPVRVGHSCSESQHLVVRESANVTRLINAYRVDGGKLKKPQSLMHWRVGGGGHGWVHGWAHGWAHGCRANHARVAYAWFSRFRCTTGRPTAHNPNTSLRNGFDVMAYLGTPFGLAYLTRSDAPVKGVGGQQSHTL